MKVIFLFLISLISFSSMADTKLSFMGSVNYNSVEVDFEKAAGVDEKSDVGFGAGLRALMGINDQLHFRSGAGLTYKKFGFEINRPGVKGDEDLSFVYLTIPATLYWKASPQVGFFGGTALNAKMSDDCDTSGNLPDCIMDDEKSLVFPLIIGFDFNFTNSFGMELSYEHGITETAKDLKVHSAVASFLYHFE